MKIRYFKNNDEYFRFIDKNRNKQIKKFMCTFTKNNIPNIITININSAITILILFSFIIITSYFILNSVSTNITPPLTCL